MIATLTRQYTPFCTLGELEFSDSYLKLATLEPAWADNSIGESCIPEGIYTCERYSSAKYPNTWEVTDVSGGRTRILLHAGNYPINTSGCVLVGMEHSSTTYAINSSAMAMGKLMELTDRLDDFDLHIMPFLVEYP